MFNRNIRDTKNAKYYKIPKIDQLPQYYEIRGWEGGKH